MFIEIDESTPITTAKQLWFEKMNMPQLLVRESPETRDSDKGLVQRWVSQSKMSIDSSPTTPPRMPELQILRGSGEGRWNHIDSNKQRTLLPRLPVRCSDEDDYCCTPLLRHQRWESESDSSESELEGSRDECPAPPSCGLRRWDSESCFGAAYNKFAPLLPKQVLELEADEEPNLVVAAVA